MVQVGERHLDLPAPSLFGTHQFDNAGLAVAAILTLGDPRIDEAAIARGVASAVWPARFQRLTTGPLGAMAQARGADLWLDGGHNPHAGRALAESLRGLLARDPRPLVLVSAMFARKDSTGFFSPFADLNPQVFATSFDSPNAASAEDIAQAAAQAGLKVEIVADVTEGVRRAWI